MKNGECGTGNAGCGTWSAGCRPLRVALCEPGLLLLLAGLAAVVCAGLCGVDRIAATALLAREPSWMREAAAIWGRFGRSGCYLAPTAVLLVWWWRFQPRRDLRRICIWLLAAEAAGGLGSRLIKIICGRWRPNQMPHGHFGFEFLAFNAKCVSFPSGHATDAAAVAAVLWFVYPRLRPLYASWVVLMAAARVLALDHFVSDVAAGAALGLLSAVAAGRALEAWYGGARPTCGPQGDPDHGR